VSKKLLFIIEQGGFPVFADEYKKAGYDVTVAQSVRKGLAELKRQSPDLICAEMNCDPNLRDRVSNLEPVLATVQSLHPSTQVIVFVEQENLPKVDILRQRFNIIDALTYPLNMEDILSSLERASANTTGT
jgi:DNA-binding NtrC family response regulator